MFRAVPIVGLLLFASAPSGAGELQTSGSERFPSNHDLSAHLGYQQGFGARIANPSGLKLEIDYAYRFHPYVWFDLSVGNVFGFGPADCTQLGSCAYRGGWASELLAGFKLKFPLPIPLVIEAPIAGGLEILYARDCGDNGAAVPVLRTGAGINYFLTRSVAIGIKTTVAFGPAFHVQSRCRTSYTDFFGYGDFLVGAEFIL